MAKTGVLETAAMTRHAPTFPSRAFRGTVRFVQRKPFGAFGAGIVLVLIVVAALAPLIAPYDPQESIPGARLLVLPGGHGDYLGEAVMTQRQTRYPELTVHLIEEFLDAELAVLPYWERRVHGSPVAPAEYHRATHRVQLHNYSAATFGP